MKAAKEINLACTAKISCSIRTESQREEKGFQQCFKVSEQLVCEKEGCSTDKRPPPKRICNCCF